MRVDRRWTPLIVASVSATVVIPALRADDDDHDDHPAAAGKVSLEHEMGAMGRAYKIIRKQVADPKQNASTLAAALDLEQHTEAAKGAVLRSAATMPSDDARRAKQADYQGEMIALLRHELDLEEALLSNNNDKAAKIVSDLHDLETEGHKEFRPKRRE